MPKQSKKTSEFEDLGQLLASIYETGYVSRRRMYRMSFIKGLFAGLGGVIGATIVVALLLWILSLLDTTPLIGPLIDGVRDTIENNQ